MPPAPPLLLVVDDEPTIRAMLQELFTEEGYAVAAVDSCDAAITRLAQGAVALVILDWVLVNADASAVLRAARADPRTATVPILALSATGRRVDFEVMLAAGATACMAKPFELDELLAWVRAHVAPPDGLQP